MLADVSGILTLIKVINHGNPRWRVSAIVEGKRRQRFFKTKADAQAWQDKMCSLSPCEQFWNSLPLLERHKIMLGYQAEPRHIVPQEGVNKSNPLAKAVSRYIEAKEGQGLRPNSLKQIKWNLGLLGKAFKRKQCHEISTTMIEGWFRKRCWQRSTVDGAIAKIGPFFNWCIREGLADKNPLKGAMLPKADQTEPCIFNPEETQRLLGVSIDRDPSMLPYLVLGIFAGVRPDEIMRLKWGDISENGIHIRGQNAKTRQRRIVSVSGNLKAWLSLGGAWPPRNKRKRLEALRQASGVPWGHDIMRHSFASYHLAYHGSPDRTAHELGHRDTQMLYRHYRQLVTREAAETFWAIRPQLCNKD